MFAHSFIGRVPTAKPHVAMHDHNCSQRKYQLLCNSLEDLPASLTDRKLCQAAQSAMAAHGLTGLRIVLDWLWPIGRSKMTIKRPVGEAADAP